MEIIDQHHYHEDAAEPEQIGHLLEEVGSLVRPPLSIESPVAVTPAYSFSTKWGKSMDGLGDDLRLPTEVLEHLKPLDLRGDNPAYQGIATDRSILFSAVEFLDRGITRDSGTIAQISFSLEGMVIPFGRYHNEVRYDIIKDIEEGSSDKEGALRIEQDIMAYFTGAFRTVAIDRLAASQEVKDQHAADRPFARYSPKALDTDEHPIHFPLLEEKYNYAQENETEHGFNEVSAETAQHLLEFLRQLKASEQQRSVQL